MGASANLSALISFDVRGIQMVAKADAAVSGLARSTGGLTTSFTESAVAARTFDTMTHKLGSWIPKLTSDFGQLELALQRAKGVLGTTEKGLEAVNRIKLAALDMRDVEHAPVALVSAYTDFERAGISGSAAMDNLRVVSDVATVSQMSLAHATEAVSTAQLAWAGPMMSSRDIMEQFHGATTKSMWSLDKLIHAMGYVHGSAIAYNQDLNETLTQLAMIAPIAGTSTRAGTALRGAFTALGDAKKQLQFKKLGIELKDATGQFKPFSEIMVAFIEKTAKLDPLAKMALVKKMFDKRGLDVYSGTLRTMEEGVSDINGKWVKGAAAVAEYKKQVAQGRTQLGDAAKLARDSLPMIWEKLKLTMSRTFMELGEKLAGLFRAIAPTLTRIAGGLEVIFKSPLGHVIALGASLLTIVGTLKLMAFTWRSLGLAQIFSLGGGATGAGGLAGTAAASMMGAGASAGGGVAAAVAARSGFAAGRSGGAGGAFEYALTRPGSKLGAVGSAIGGLAGAAASAIGPFVALAATVWGVMEVLDYFRRKEDARRQLYEKYKGSVESFDLIAKGLVEMAKLGQNKAGNAQMSPELLGKFNERPELSWMLGHARQSMQFFDSLDPAGRAKLLRESGLASGTTAAQYGIQNAGQRAGQLLAQSGMSEYQRAELLSVLSGVIRRSMSMLSGVDMGGLPALHPVTAEQAKGAKVFDFGDEETKASPFSKQQRESYAIQPIIEKAWSAQVDAYAANTAAVNELKLKIQEEITSFDPNQKALETMTKELKKLITAIESGGTPPKPSTTNNDPLGAVKARLGLR